METLTDTVGLPDENELLLARVAARAYILGDLERSLTSQRKAKVQSGPTHRLRITTVLEVDKLYPDTVR